MTEQTAHPSPAASGSATNGAIVLDQVGKTYGSGEGAVEAIRSISLTFAQGQSVAIVGPSGCGKSTLMRMIAGLDDLTAGSIRIGDRQVTGPVRDIGVVFQRDLLLDWRSVLDNVLLPAEIRGMDMAAASKRAMALLEELDVAGFAKHYPWQLSGGMRQRVAIARALLPSPHLMFLDEPFSALDAMTRDQMNVLLQQIQAAEHVTTLLITHSILEAVFVADRVLVMSGRPGAILDDITVDFPRPRKLELRETPAFTAIVGRIREQFVKTGDLVG
ncbi:ABC transporter ATP-binding protein [Oceanibacterium hippocampi]|uniref:Taurine import ATP-binding protein TauB n=1 Tax=Oceanibacterium hippocampi TaxID=745714 RepID=A0A1Y5SQZ6_9PROT|nr:ABC transporter ATP-binding protein [Oceanibacterium hippocampi]SLN46265.1 Taurine import ATP-binding protein TauB [Oceanibacterium hippocampi]